MWDALCLGLWGVHWSHFEGALGEVAGLSGFIWLVIIAIVLTVLALAIYLTQKSRRKRLVSQLLTQQKAMEAAGKSLFSDRKADDIRESVREPGKPKTVITEGAVAYTETGDMLVFRSTPVEDEGDAVISAVGRREEKVAQLPQSWAPSYRLERVIALHITGVAMFSVDGFGRVEDGKDLEPELLVTIEQLLERAMWFGGEMVCCSHQDRTVCLTWGGDIHLVAVVDGEPDERLDRELRWAIGDLVDQYPDEIWSWSQDTTKDIRRTLTTRIADVFNLTKDVDLEAEAARSADGSLRVTSTVSWRHSLAEYTLGILNRGPGPVYDVELLPTLSKEGVLDVVNIEGVEVDKEMKFLIHEIPQGRKARATFIMRPLESKEVRMDCTVVYLRGVANVSEVRLPGRWIELETVDLLPGNPVEPERVLEIAMQPAAFRDRCALFIPPGVQPEKLFNEIIDALRMDLFPVVELEDDEVTQLEAWFHGEILGGGTVVASVTVVPNKGIVDIFAATTRAGVLPGCMHKFRGGVERAVRQKLSEVVDPELRSTVPKMGVLLLESWG